MSLNHLTNPNVNVNCKSLKINNISINDYLENKTVYKWNGSFGVQGERYLEAYSGNGTSGLQLRNMIKTSGYIKYLTIEVFRQNTSPTTTFILYNTDDNLTNPVDLATIILNPNESNKSQQIDLKIIEAKPLFVRTSSSGNGNPQDVSFFLYTI